jgi:hypothetical protein
VASTGSLKGLAQLMVTVPLSPKSGNICCNSEDQIGRFIRLAEQLENGINSGVFYPNESYLCAGCGYQGMCERW